MYVPTCFLVSDQLISTSSTTLSSSASPLSSLSNKWRASFTINIPIYRQRFLPDNRFHHHHHHHHQDCITNRLKVVVVPTSISWVAITIKKFYADSLNFKTLYTPSPVLQTKDFTQLTVALTNI